MSATATIDQTAAQTIAAKHGFTIETHRQCGGDYWDVRVYGNGSGGYDRRRDVSARNIPSQIVRMVAAKVANLTYEQAKRLSPNEALDILA